MTRRISAAAALVALVACGSDSGTEPRLPSDLALDRATLTLEIGDTLRVNASILDQHGRAFDVPPAGFDVTWASSNALVASVQDGLVTAVSSGTVTITASAGTLSAQLPATILARTVTMQLSFTYSGDWDGSFSVSAIRRLDDLGDNVAISFYDADYGSHDILAERLRSDGRFDLIWFWFDGPPITAAAALEISDGLVILGFDPQWQAWEGVYLLVSGDAEFTSVTGRQVAGTFEIELAEETTMEGLTVAAGAFDVPFVTLEELGLEPAFGPAATPGLRVIEPLRELRASRR
jgi:hypothetical protein